VRKVIVLVISSLLFYLLFREMTPFKMLILCVAIAAAYGVSRVPAKHLAAAKYPTIGVSLALCPVLIIYPALRPHFAITAAVMFLAFYSTGLFLVTLDEKGKKVSKEITGLMVLYVISALNLFLVAHSELILPLSISILIFLFIINRVHVMPYVAGATVIVAILLLVSGVRIIGPAVHLLSAERYSLLAAAFALLLFVYVAYIKRPDFVTILAFFGLLFISVDLLMSVGLNFRGVLLHQPILALFIAGPVVGIAMKGGKDHP
jgi:hypothetical protein